MHDDQPAIRRADGLPHLSRVDARDECAADEGRAERPAEFGAELLDPRRERRLPGKVPRRMVLITEVGPDLVGVEGLAHLVLREVGQPARETGRGAGVVRAHPVEP
jgi:hypothetical protein